MKKQQLKSGYLKKREEFADALRLPGDSIGASIISITGNKELLIENYRGIITYNDTKMLIQGRNDKICICGENLKIDYYTNEDMKVCGKISNIQFV